MKKLIKVLIVLVVAGVCAAAVIRHFWPESIAGKVVLNGWDVVKAQYENVRGLIEEKLGSDKGEANENAEPQPVVQEQSETPETAAESESEQDEPEPKAASVPLSGPGAFVKSNRYCGRAVKVSKLKGKVVLVYVWNKDKPESVELLSRIEQLWRSFKHKPFVVIGSHRGERGEDVAKILKSKKVTFPVYQGAGLEAEPAIRSTPFLYIVNHVGKLKFMGRDDRRATEVIVNAFGDINR